jgi:uncharacterized protein YqeY
MKIQIEEEEEEEEEENQLLLIYHRHLAIRQRYDHFQTYNQHRPPLLDQPSHQEMQVNHYNL